MLGGNGETRLHMYMLFKSGDFPHAGDVRCSSDSEIACAQSKTIPTFFSRMKETSGSAVPGTLQPSALPSLLLTSVRTRPHNSIVAAADLLVSNDILAVYIHQLLWVQVAQAVDERKKNTHLLPPTKGGWKARSNTVY